MPIEHALLKKGDIKQSALTISEFRDKCKEFAIKNVNHQLGQFQQLGLIADFKDKYLTFYPDFENNQLLLFLDMIKKGLVYQDYKPVFWSWSSHSALAEAEIEYQDAQAYSIYVVFEVTTVTPLISKGDKLLIWTTTP
ncbi:MAG: class I tRNA ligase family protein [Clostridia bacterium]|nr:class I tRNA ligase family protein [Clostridia bacterium]